MKMSRRIVINVLLFSALLTPLFLLGPQQPAVAEASVDLQADTYLWISPNQLWLRPRNTGRTEVWVQYPAGTGLVGIEFVITFDPTLVQVMDADPTAPGVQIGLGTCFAGKDYFIGRNWVNNDDGRIEFAVTLYQPAFPIEGCCSAASITWRALVAGWSPIHFESSKLVDYEGIPIGHYTLDGSVGSDTRPPICGRVKLQGRSDDELQDTLVILTEEPCLPSIQSAEAGQAVPQAINIIPDMPYTYTDRQGCFKIIPYDNPHDYRCLVVFHHGYLVGQQALPRGGFSGPHHLGVIRLLGGDVTEDDVVNIFDLVKVASHISPGPYDEVADINDDGIVDISDLAITAGNFGKCGPISRWDPDDGVCPCQ